MDENFSFTKFVMSFFQWLPWVKTVRHLLGIIIVAVIVGCIYVKFFKKTGGQETTFSGDVQNVNIIQKDKRLFIPFVEGFAGVETQHDEMNAGIRAGLRFEF